MRIDWFQIDSYVPTGPSMLDLNLQRVKSPRGAITFRYATYKRLLLRDDFKKSSIGTTVRKRLLCVFLPSSRLGNFGGPIAILSKISPTNLRARGRGDQMDRASWAAQKPVRKPGTAQNNFMPGWADATGRVWTEASAKLLNKSINENCCSSSAKKKSF